MSLNDRLSEDMKQAMKNKEKLTLSVIRMVRSAIKNAEIESKSTLSDDEVITVLNRELKQRRESLQEFKNAGREDLVEGLLLEIEILQQYLPEQLTEQELKDIIQSVINEVGATSKKDMGKVMGALIPKINGRADGKLASQLVQQYLN